MMLAEGLRPCWSAASDAERAHDPAVAGALDDVAVRDEAVEQERAALDHAPGLAQDDAGLVAGGRGDVDLGLGLAVGVEHVQAGGAGHRGLGVLARDAEADLVVDAEAGRGVELEGLPPELALPVLVDERPAGPAALGVADVALAVRGEVGAAGEGIGDHGSAHIADHPKPWREADVGGERVERTLGLDPQADPRRRREAELAGELAELVGVVADDLVERVLDELAALPADQRARLGVATARRAAYRATLSQ